ncbi:MAG: hypothetical protein ABFE07_29435 [Armatimonadia bacterium]
MLLSKGVIEARGLLCRKGELLMFSRTIAIRDELRPHLDKIIRAVHADIEATFGLGSVLPGELVAKEPQ